jgi:hypothetical protein
MVVFELQQRACFVARAGMRCCNELGLVAWRAAMAA